jgi:hypothetical protein
MSKSRDISRSRVTTRPGRGCQKLEQTELPEPEVDGATRDGGGAGPLVDREIAQDKFGRLAAGRSPDDGPQPRVEFAQVEGFHEVVVRPEVEQAHLVVDLGPRGRDQHGQVLPVPPQAPQDRHAVRGREREVEDQDVEAFGRHQVVDVVPVRCPGDGMAVPPQVPLDGLAKVAVILDQADLHGTSRGLPVRPGGRSDRA